MASSLFISWLTLIFPTFPSLASCPIIQQTSYRLIKCPLLSYPQEGLYTFILLFCLSIFLRADIASPHTRLLTSQDHPEYLYLICLLSTCYVSFTNKVENEILLLLLTLPHLFPKTTLCKDIQKQKPGQP